jgi:carbamoyl-phosphate synthase large subunit
MKQPITWIISTIGKRGYLARYLREASPRGSRVVGTGNDPRTVGFVACDQAYELPAIAEDRYPEAVLEVCRKEGVTAALCASDLDVPVIAGLRNRMEAMGIACFVPDYATAIRFLDKWETAKYLNDHAFDTPDTYVDLDEAVSAMGFPIVIKPRCGSASAGFAIVHDERTARTQWAGTSMPIAQRYVVGRQINVEACSDTRGNLLSMCSWIRHSSVSGETLLAETVRHEAALRIVRRLLEASPVPGPVDVDLIDTGGIVYVLELNTRFGGGYPVSHLAGADFPGAMVASLSGDPPRELCTFREGVLMMKELTPVQFEPSQVIRDMA